jgi:hypothetical protein
MKGHLRKNSKESIHDAARHLLPEVGHLKMVGQFDAAILCSALAAIAAKKTCRNPGAKAKLVREGEWGYEEPPVHSFRHLSASTVNKCRRLGLEVNEVAAELDPRVRPINWKRVPVRDEEAVEIDPYTPHEMRRLLQAAEGTVAHMPVLMYAFLGLRLREGAGLLAADLDESGVLHVVRQVDNDNDNETTTALKTRYSKRDLPLPKVIAEELRRASIGGGRIMKNTLGRPMAVDGIDRALFAAMRRAGLRRLTVHQLRHSFSSWLEESGCPRSIRLRLMGQSRKAVQDRYNHASEQGLTNWLQALWDASLKPAEENGSTVETPVIDKSPKSKTVGSGHGRSMLDEAAVVGIRRRLEEGDAVATVAKDHGLDRGTIRAIRDRRTWRHVA